MFILFLVFQRWGDSNSHLRPITVYGFGDRPGTPLHKTENPARPSRVRVGF